MRNSYLLCALDRKINVNEAIYRVVDFFVLVPIILFVLCSKDDLNLLPLIGIMLVAISLYNCIKVKNNKLLIMLFLIIGFINISIGVTDFINGAASVSQWQLNGLRLTVYNVYAAKSLLLANVVFSFFLIIDDSEWAYRNKETLRENNLFISLGGLLVLFLILGYGIVLYGFDSGKYISVSTPIFEYSLCVVVVVWYYSKNYIFNNIILKLYIICFSVYFLFRGDRSSVIMLIVLGFLMYYYKYFKVWHIIAGGVIAVFMGNFIGLTRNLEMFSIGEMFDAVLKRGVYVDTFSYSYYTGIAMSALHEYDINHFEIGKEFLLYQIGMSEAKYASNIAVYARESFQELYNQGGGLFAAPFYSFAGYLGVIVASAFVGFFLRKIFVIKNKKVIMYQLLIVSMCFRWYLYSPTTLIRGIFILFSGFIILIDLFMALAQMIGVAYDQRKKA